MIIQMTYTLYVIHTMIDRKATRQTLQHLHEILPTLQMRSSLHLRLAVGIALPMIIKSEAIKDIPRGIPPLDESAVVDDLISNILWDPLGLTGADTKVPGVVDRGVGAGYICGKYGAVAHEPGEGAGIHDAVSYLAVFGLRGTEHCILIRLLVLLRGNSEDRGGLTALDSLSAKCWYEDQFAVSSGKCGRVSIQ
jgi:hypothetical protein